MRIVDLICEESVRLGVDLNDKASAIEMLVDLQMKSGCINDKALYKEAILARENISSTAVGDGIAVPHAKSEAVKKPSLAVITVPKGVDYDSFDEEKSKLIFMIAAPNDGNLHLEVLSKLMTLLMDKDFCNKLINTTDVNEFIRIIDETEKAKYGAEKINDIDKTSEYQVLAVTACPTGIAHTYMAAEALERAAKELGITIKVETNGSGGIKNKLNQDDIRNCDGIIVAADKSVEMSRFEGKKVVITKVTDGIKCPEDLIEKIVSGNAKVYSHKGTKVLDEDNDNESFGRRIYKHLMNGVSNMLPFTVAGGIFIAIAFLIDSLMGAPQDSEFGTHNDVAAFLKIIGGYAFNFMIPVLAGYIGKSIADRPGFLVGLIGGFLANTGSTFTNATGDIPSGFLGALFAGFVGGYIMLAIIKICNYLPESLNGIKSVLIYPILGLAVISIVMCTINPFMGIINNGLSDFLNRMGDNSKIVLGCILGAMMSIDMGGPFNKAAYVFGTAAIASGNYDIMAAVMVGGMVPPIAIALATFVFKGRWTEEERKNAPVNYIMGLSFITEGAIPYAAADPLRVIPSCMVGAATAGGLSMAFNCTLMAPHGGIFVFAVVGNWALYLLSLAIGSVVGMIMLGILKRNI